MGKKYGKIILPAVAAIAAGVGAVHTYGDYNRTDNTLMLLNAEGLSAMADPGEPGDGNSDKDDPMITIFRTKNTKCYELQSPFLKKRCHFGSQNSVNYGTREKTDYGIVKCEEFDLVYNRNGIKIQESKTIRKSQYQNYSSDGWNCSGESTAIYESQCQQEHGKYAVIKDCAPGTVEQHSLLVCPGYREGYPRS